MGNAHQISEYINNISFKESLGMGYNPDEVYEAICNMSSMYNQVLSEAYKENDELKTKVAMLETQGLKSLESRPEVVQVPEPESEVEDKVPTRSLSDKELQRLKRVDLLELLLEQSKENESLKQMLKEKDKEMKQLQKKVEGREIIMKEAGSIAEVSFQLNGVFEAAENAAKQYLDNLQAMHDKECYEFLKKEEEMEGRCQEMLELTSKRCDALLDETEQQCEQMLDETEQQCEQMLDEAERFCSERERETEDWCNSLEEKTKRDVEKRWNDLAARVREMYSSRQELRSIRARRG